MDVREGEVDVYIATHHRTLIAVDEHTGLLRQVKQLPPTGSRLALIDISDREIEHLKADGVTANHPAAFIDAGPLAGCEYVASTDQTTFSLRKAGFFACAQQISDDVVFHATIANAWEMFRLVSHHEAAVLIHPIQDADALAENARALIARGKPVCLHFGCGPRRIDGFLNIDKYPYLTHAADYFNFDFVERAWPIPDSCVDYIYSEDFIEHIPQKSQLAFLAESFRVLKVGAFNRVNTPCLRASMQQSDFARGFSGVYFEEYDKWSHIALFTPASLQEMASITGYRHVFLTAKSRGTSPHAVADTRPGGDRNELVGNIFADLLK